MPEHVGLVSRRYPPKLALRLVEPGGLEAGESFVEPALAPLVVGQDAHGVVVAQLVDDQSLPGRAVVDHHGELGAAALDPVHVGDLGPARNGPKSRSSQASAVSVRWTATPPPQVVLVARLVEHVHRDITASARPRSGSRDSGHGEVVRTSRRTRRRRFRPLRRGGRIVAAHSSPATRSDPSRRT